MSIKDNNKVKKGTTKRCCYATCRSDTRYNSFRNNLYYFINFPKPCFPYRQKMIKTPKEQHIKVCLKCNKCDLWVKRCGRGDGRFQHIDNVNKDTYICSLHFEGESGPTDDHPHPIGCVTANYVPDKKNDRRQTYSFIDSSIDTEDDITIPSTNTFFSRNRKSIQHPSLEPIILIHGGAGDIHHSRKDVMYDGVKKAAQAGYDVLQNGGNSLDAVEAAVKVMEDDEAFNAGYGSVLNLDGDIEMDASIMVGSTLSFGSVTGVRDIAHPISLARMVMEQTPHVMLAGAGANKFAKEQGVPILPEGSLVTEFSKNALDKYKKLKDSGTEVYRVQNPGEVGTVGAVAMDKYGKLAAASSTGGTNGKMAGGSSHTSMIGSGIYADDSIGAVSCTGHGEVIAKYCLAHAILKEMQYANKSANAATHDILKKMSEKLKNIAGAITLSRTGEVGIGFTSERMSWAYRKGNTLHYGIERDEEFIENV